MADKREPEKRLCYCPFCDAELGKEASYYCHVCNVEILCCPKCGRPVSRERTVCPHCGANIKEEAAKGG